MARHLRAPEVVDLRQAIGVPIAVEVGDGDGSVQVTVVDDRGARSVVVSGSRVRRVPPPRMQERGSSRSQPAAVTASGRVARGRGRGPLVLVDLLLGLIALLVVGVVITNLTGMATTRVVLTGSMLPGIAPGDVIVTVPVSRRSPEVGDVITYTAQRFDGSEVAPLTHRIIGIDSEGRFITKGDAAADPDVQHPTLTDVTGVLVAVVPRVGVLLQPLVLLGILVVILAVWLVVDWGRRRP